MIRRQAKPCMNLHGMYRWFDVVSQGLIVSLLFSLFGDFRSLLLVIFLCCIWGLSLQDFVWDVCTNPSCFFLVIPLQNSRVKVLDFGVLLDFGKVVFLVEILRFHLIQRVLVDQIAAMGCPWGTHSIPKVLFEFVEWIGRLGSGFGGSWPAARCSSQAA
jgi:hypothetical protein